MKYPEIAEVVIGLKDADLKLRQTLIANGKLGIGYNKVMEDLHNSNANTLSDIIDKIGYPTIEQVGTLANEAAWLVIQHAIGQPLFMKKCLQFLKKAVAEEKENPQHLAQLSDRIAVFEGRPQLYGTQFDWTADGKLNPNTYDDLDAVNRRRKSVGLNSLEAQTEKIRANAKSENQLSPLDFDERKQAMDVWRKSVGWAEAELIISSKITHYEE